MDFAAYFPVWDKLTPDQQTQLARSAVLRTVAAGTVVHRGGTGCTGLLLVRSGQLRAFMISPEGREITLYRLVDRDLCLMSATCILRSIQFEVTITAEKQSSFWVIPPDKYRQLMEVSAPVANYTNEVMAARFSEVMWRTEQILWQSFDKRLAAFLLEEAGLEDSDTLTITHEAIANHMGSAREVVTRMLRYFQSEGLVQLRRGTVTLAAPDRLRALAES